jgi:rubrerythrin
MGKDTLGILDLLIEHELVIKQLYDVFAKHLPDHHHFWHNIATEEQSHADRLGLLHATPSLSGWLASENRLKAEAIKSSISYVDGQTEKARQEHFPQLQALALARDIEGALLERVFSRVSDSVPADIRVTFMDLAADTERHRKTIAAMLESEKKLQKTT